MNYESSISVLKSRIFYLSRIKVWIIHFCIKKNCFNLNFSLLSTRFPFFSPLFFPFIRARLLPRMVSRNFETTVRWRSTRIRTFSNIDTSSKFALSQARRTSPRKVMRFVLAMSFKSRIYTSLTPYIQLSIFQNVVPHRRAFWVEVTAEIIPEMNSVTREILELIPLMPTCPLIQLSIFQPVDSRGVFWVEVKRLK